MELIWLVIGGTLIGISAASMALYKKGNTWPMILLFMGIAFIIVSFNPLKTPVNLWLLLLLATVNGIWVGVLSHKFVPRFSFLVGILGGVITLLYAFLLSFQ
ncbi:MAG: hypothetical protein ACE5QW_02770 [Thermoplasmata archaeon]